MPKPINFELLDEYGVSTNHEQMDNGELRFRLSFNDGSGYIRAENHGTFAWGNSHSHLTIKEMTIVQTGRAIYAEYINGNVIYHKLVAGDFIITRPGIPHNHCFDEKTSVHTVKFGDCKNKDWIECTELDDITKKLTFSQAWLLAK